jgi:CRP-like cAMP-binding protein
MMIADLLSAQLFREVPYQDVDMVSRFSQRVVMDDGEFLIREDERDFDLFILLRGSVEIVSNERVAISEECVLSRNHKELLGEIGWLTQRRRTAAVRCRGTVEAIRIDGVALSQYLMDNPKVGLRRYAQRCLASRSAHGSDRQFVKADFVEHGALIGVSQR